MNGLTLSQLARSTRSSPVTLLDVLREEIAAGRVEKVENGQVTFRLTEQGRRELEPLFVGIAGFTAIRDAR